MVSLCVFAQNENAASLPYSNDFETTDLDGWSIINNGEGKPWQRAKSTGGTQVIPSSGEYFMRYSYSMQVAADTWLFSKPLKLTAGQKIKISYDHKTAASNATGTMKESYKLTIGKAATIESQTTELLKKEDFVTLNNKYEKVELIYTVPETGEYNLGFYCYSKKGAWDLMIDNVKVEVAEENLGTVDVNQSEFKVYPNPTTDFINFAKGSVVNDVRIYDMSGSQVLYIKESTGKISVQNLKAGNYIIQAEVNGNKISNKFIKK